MAFVLTYNTLTTSVKDYLERDDPNLISQIPVFIMLGERRISRDLKILGLKVAITDNFTVSQGTFQKPTRWLNDSSFNIGTGTAFNARQYLLQRSVEWCRLYWPDPTQTGTPKYYASDYNYDYWIVVPTPDIAYPYEVLYYETPQLIDETISTSFLTGNLPDALIYASLLEAAVYLKDDDRIRVWQDRYDRARQAISDEDIRRIEDAFSKRGG